MPDDAYERHLRRAHADELTPIDARRVGRSAGGERSRRVLLYASVGGVLAMFVLGYGFLFLGSDVPTNTAAVQPDSSSPIHEHGLVSVAVDGEAVDFTDPQYLGADECFHFHAEGDDGDGADDHDHGDGAGAPAMWHVHCENVTLEYALETLGIEASEDRVVVDGRTYDAAEGDTVSVTVDGEPVDPETYVLEGVEPVEDARHGGGDDVEVVVRSGG